MTAFKNGGDGRESRDRKHFDSIADRYGRKDLHPAGRIARSRRIHATFSAIPRLSAPTVLEVGCGAGFAATYLEGAYSTYTGIDYASGLIDFALQHNNRDRVDFHVANAKVFGSDSAFDVVFMVGVLHHIPEKDAVIANLVRLLKPGGWLVMNEPQPHNPVIRLARLVRSKLDRGYSSEQEELARDAMATLLQSHGLRNVLLAPQGLFSTPFAEVPFGPARLMRPLASSAVAVDRFLELRLEPVVRRLAWNCIAAGQRPDE